MSPGRPVDAAFAAGRRRKAIQFLTTGEEIMDLAEDGADIGDAYVTLCVHAGSLPRTPCAPHWEGLARPRARSPRHKRHDVRPEAPGDALDTAADRGSASRARTSGTVVA